MSVVVITPPAQLIPTEDAKVHLRVVDDVDDALITALLMAAQQHIDGPDGTLGRAVGLQTLELKRRSFYGCECGGQELYGSGSFGRCYCCHPGGGIRLPFPRLIDIVSIKYDDPAGVEQTIDPALYAIFDDRFVAPAYNGAWPTPRNFYDAVRIRYRAGYAKLNDADPPALADDLPAPIRAALLLHVGFLYENREAVNIGNIVNELPLGVLALLSPYRVFV